MRLRSLFLLCQVALLSGFSIELFFCGMGANWLINEPRPMMDYLEDIYISEQISRKLANDTDCERNANISATSYNKIVLLTGQAVDESLKQKAYQYSNQTPKVRGIFNQITINPTTDMRRRIQDRLLFEIIRAKLLMTSHLRYHHFKVIIENGEVFILGKAQTHEAHLAATTIQKTRGVKKIIKLIELT